MSITLDIQRIFREGLVTFWRNKLVSFSALLVTTLSLLVLSSLIFLSGVIEFSLAQLQDRVDVNIYFLPDANESEILDLQNRISLIPEVRDVSYVSREQALLDFEERHRGNELITRSLDELGGNPLGASLNIRAQESTQYEAVVRAIESEPAVAQNKIVEHINFYDNKALIDRLNQFASVARLVGYAVMGFLAVIAVLVIMAMMRIAIYGARGEIKVKRLVGAEHRYIRGPFLMIGGLYGIFSAILTMIILYPITSWIGSSTKTFFGGMDIFNFYVLNAVEIFLMILGAGIILGVLSSWLAIRKHLNV
jgi:cell division transport system permease protein